MSNSVASLQSPARVRGVSLVLLAALMFLGLPGSSYAFDAKSDAREEIRKFKADVSEAKRQISDRESRIFAGDLLIIANQVALDEAKKKPDNDAAVIVLQLTMAGLKYKKDDLTKEKQDWERYKRESEKGLAEWEAYLRKLGG